MCIRESCILPIKFDITSNYQRRDAISEYSSREPAHCMLTRSETNDLRKAKQSHNSEADVTQQLPGDDETENKEVTYNY